jgi:hypothetical protein
MIVTNGTKNFNMLAKKPYGRECLNTFDAKHVRGIRAGFDLELTCMMLSRALFVNSCSIKVDIVARIPTHTKDNKNNLCAW